MDNKKFPRLQSWTPSGVFSDPTGNYVDADEAMEYAKSVRLDTLEEAAAWIEANVTLAVKLVEIGKEPFYIPAMETVEGKTMADEIRKLGEQ